MYQMERRTVAVLSFALEANIFNPVPRKLTSFRRLEGDEYQNDDRQAGFVPKLRATSPQLFENLDVEFICLFRGFCGGLMPADDFEETKAIARNGLEALASLRRVDGIFLDLHGAMGVQGRDASGDAEAELVETVRQAVSNPDALISASFDLHGNFSERLGRVLDCATAYKTMPHVDMEETKTKGLQMLLEALQQGLSRRDVNICFVKIPAVLSGDIVMTTEGPGVKLYQSLKELEASVDGLWDVSLFVGHQHADEARLGASVVLTGSRVAAGEMSRCAREVAQKYWDLRNIFDYPICCKLEEWDICLDEMYRAFDRGEQLLVGDFGDNVCAGASGDVPFALRALAMATSEPRDNGHPKFLLLGVVDPEAVSTCLKVGVNGIIPELAVGAALTQKFEHHYGVGCEPLLLCDVTVAAVLQDGAWALINVGPSITVLLQAFAWGFFGPRDFDPLPDEYKPCKFNITVAKMGINLMDVLDSGIKDAEKRLGFVSCIMANTPGATHEPLPARNHISRPMFPLDDAMEWTAPLGISLTSF